MQTLLDEFKEARDFALDTHAPDVHWMHERCAGGFVQTFDEFYHEYVYVVLASGFSSKTAARLVPLMLECRGDQEAMLGVFKNRVKCTSLAKMHAKNATNPNWWPMVRELALMQTTDEHRANVLRNEFAYIGNVTKWHLARNTGLVNCAKPDVHMVRYAKAHGYAETDRGVVSMVDSIVQHYNKLVPWPWNDAISTTAGTVDFMLWIWLSHKRGPSAKATAAPCCHGGRPLR